MLANARAPRTHSPGNAYLARSGERRVFRRFARKSEDLPDFLEVVLVVLGQLWKQRASKHCAVSAKERRFLYLPQRDQIGVLANVWRPYGDRNDLLGQQLLGRVLLIIIARTDSCRRLDLPKPSTQSW